MQGILSNRKRYLRKSEHRDLKLPLWPELSIGRLWPEAQQLPRFSEYLPDDWTLQNPKKIERNIDNDRTESNPGIARLSSHSYGALGKNIVRQ